MGIGNDVALAGNHEAAAVSSKRVLAGLFGRKVNIQAYHAIADMLHDIRKRIYLIF
ncbi:hypothetical protein SDC9_212498 [bioreactor metagenome]|uniref:Uncharacterized protein n=1 Tax=bioreactor metagenome TaxID=1076179 RepID=A0A645JN58_9ZZZZ